jgi:hypothetical protein
MKILKMKAHVQANTWRPDLVIMTRGERRWRGREKNRSTGIASNMTDIIHQRERKTV